MKDLFIKIPSSSPDYISLMIIRWTTYFAFITSFNRKIPKGMAIKFLSRKKKRKGMMPQKKGKKVITSQPQKSSLYASQKPCNSSITSANCKEAKL